MNERIRELAERAGHYVNETYKPPVRSKTHDKIWEDGHIGWNELFQEKFAELIVEECGRHLMSQEFIGRRDLDWSLVLNEHFDIK